MKLLTLLTVLLLKVFHVTSYFDTNNAKVYEMKVKGYSGYSILLQNSGATNGPNCFIVGSPKGSSGVQHCTFFSNFLPLCSPLFLSSVMRGIDYKDSYLGMAIAGNTTYGGMIITCAPRLLNKVTTINYYLTGKCIAVGKHRDGVGVPVTAHEISPLDAYGPTTNIERKWVYDSAFAQLGFDVKYRRTGNVEEILMGAPGKIQWSGASVKVTRMSSTTSEHEVLPTKNRLPIRENEYFGYSVSWGHFLLNSTTTWYVAGVPRGGVLHGQVIIYDKTTSGEKIKIIQEFTGEEFGSYFGASLATVNINGVDNVLAGAPMYSGSTYDEGCVYFYKNLNFGTFRLTAKLSGGEKIKSRFGTTIVVLGDIDLDSYNDIAIGAPYEDDGVGAVYIYLGTRNGFENKFSQRLSPLEIDNGLSKNALGFGLGISNGNDIDYNGHNDVVIGAYQSDLIFLFKTLTVLDYYTKIIATDALLNTTSNLFITFCVQVSARNKKLSTVKTKISIILDRRTLGPSDFEEVVDLKTDQGHCFNRTVSFKGGKDLAPFQVKMACTVNQKGFTSKVDTLTENIPLTSMCGQDGICQTELFITVDTKKNIVLGLDKELYLNVTMGNSGEPGFKTELSIDVPVYVDLINLEQFVQQNGIYTTQLEEPLIKSKPVTRIIRLDLRDMLPTIQEIVIKLELSSLGTQNNNSKVILKLPVIVQNNPFIKSQSNPSSIQVGNKNLDDKIKFAHEFILGNLGPSPYKILVDFFVLTSLDVKAFKAIFNDNEIGCNQKNTNESINGSFFNKQLNISSIRRRSRVVNCSLEKCLLFNCEGGYLYKPNDNAIFTITYTIQIDTLVNKYGNSQDQDIVIFETSAIVKNNMHSSVGSTVSIPIYGVYKKPSIPLWVYILSVFLAALLLFVNVYVLYRCNFFTRTYREKLVNEGYEEALVGEINMKNIEQEDEIED